MSQPITNLPIGSKIKFGKHQVNLEVAEDIVWQIGHKNKTGYPSSSITLVTEKIIDLRGVDAKEPSNSDSSRRSYGNNRYRYSNIRQWLNNESGHPWFAKTHTADEPPADGGMNQPTGYDVRDGFLSAFTDDELDAILDTTLTVAKNTAVDGGGSEVVVDKVFLLSNTEVGLAQENSIDEGSKLDLFTNDASRVCKLTQQAFNNTKSASKPSAVDTAWHWWLRTPYASYANYVRYVHTSGSLDNRNAFIGHVGVRPALNLKSDILVSDTTDIDGSYTIIHNQPPIISGQDEDLGTKTNEFSYPYSVEIGDGNITNITEKINEEVISSYDNPVELNRDLVINNETMRTLEFYKTHTIEIIVTDDNNMVTTRTLEFTKGVQTLLADTPLLEVVDKVADIPMLIKGGKDLVGEAITGVDDSVVIPTDPTFQGLASAIGSISTGKKWASGTATAGDTTMQFNTPSGTANAMYLTVSGLDFTPSHIYVQGPDITGILCVYSPTLRSNGSPSQVAQIFCRTQKTTSTSITMYPFVMSGNAYVNNGGFRMPITFSTGGTWLAIE